MIRKSIILLLFSAAAVGCSGLHKNFPRKNFFTIEAEIVEHAGLHGTGKSDKTGFSNNMRSVCQIDVKDTAGTKRKIKTDNNSSKTDKVNKKNGLIIRQFGISDEFDTDYFIYRVSKFKYIDDYYNNFIVSPAAIITGEIENNLYTSSCFKYVPCGELEQIKYRLWGKVIAIYCDMRNKNHPAAVMEIRLILEKKTKSGFKSVINKIYRASRPVIPDEYGAQDIVKAWGICLGHIISNFCNNTGCSLAG